MKAFLEKCNTAQSSTADAEQEALDDYQLHLGITPGITRDLAFLVRNAVLLKSRFQPLLRFVAAMYTVSDETRRVLSRVTFVLEATKNCFCGPLPLDAVTTWVLIRTSVAERVHFHPHLAVLCEGWKERAATVLVAPLNEELQLRDPMTLRLPKGRTVQNVRIKPGQIVCVLTAIWNKLLLDGCAADEKAPRVRKRRCDAGKKRPRGERKCVAETSSSESESNEHASIPQLRQTGALIP